MFSGGKKENIGIKWIKDTFAYIASIEILLEKVKLPCFCLRYSKIYLVGRTKFIFMKKGKMSKM